MKSLLVAILMGFVLFGISSCATVPAEPIGPGELRLLSMRPSEGGNWVTGNLYSVTVNFQADGHPEISRACCYWAGNGPYCYQAKYITYGSPGDFTVVLSTGYEGSTRLECFADYVRDGKKRRTNSVTSYVHGIVR